ncbi:MoxR family ATPase [Methylocystis iwaonis]|uniref:AAA family ATPase n=1 Tax=Methylocystis iwaonis TaxID=2885079 RepID=UPI002E7B04A3|nr:MoxR family ATPase [Methylocystis iwaonis]
MNDDSQKEHKLGQWRERALAFEQEIQKAVIGQERVIRLVTIGVFARGHIMIEGDVGVGKTTLLRAVSRALGGDFARFEGTVDMMPSDILYHTYLGDDGRPRVEASELLRLADTLPVFFFNEINRARPQVHSLLLRLMAERSVTAFNRLVNFPYLQVFADRNMVEREETFELPAAARDRFFMEISMRAPADPEARRSLIFDPVFQDVDLLLDRVAPGTVDYREIGRVARAIQETVKASPTLQSYVLNLWRALTEPASVGISLRDVDVATLVKGGASPRGLATLALAARVRAWLEGRDYLTPDDIKDVFLEVMAHRIFVDPIHALRGDEPVKQLCQAVFDTIPVP